MEMRPVFLILLCIIGAVTDPDDAHELSIFANGIVTSLNQLFNTDDLYNVTVAYEEGSGANIQSIASSLSNTFAHIKEMLQDSVAVADSLYRSETSSGSCLDDHTNESCVECYCQSTCTRTVADFESSYLFTSANSCAIHIPVDVHADHANVQCFIQWSSGLGDHFANQSMDLPFGVTHQYFGSRDGVLRFYPSSKWSLLNRCYRCPVPPADTFDARQRPWYTNTVSGSKFVVILIDMSGSMTGSRLVLALLTAKQILESLTPNDYFLIIKVAGDGSSGSLNCFSRKTRASSENILIVTEVLLNEVSGTGGRANFNSGIMQAFEVLNGSSECHRIVVVITDKDVDGQQLSQAIEDHKLLVQIRVFIFAVGPGRNNHLERIACDNGGRIYEVRGYNDILNNTQTFVNNLRSLTPPFFVDDVFWSHYRAVSGDLVLTGSLPLITNNTVDEIGEFVGVMGIDVDISNIIQNELQKYNVCSNGYGFMIDNNGQLIAHPNIDVNYIKNNLSSDDLISLDISYFEHSQDIELLRSAMINRETDSLTIPVWLPVDSRRRYQLKNVTYHFAPVENTPFSVAVALPDSEPPGTCVYTSIPEEGSNDVGISNTLQDGSRNFDAFAGYSNESLYNYLSCALAENSGDEVFSLYADPLGVFAIKNLLHSNMSSVLSTSYDAVDTILLDQLFPTRLSDTGGHNVSVYLLDSSGLVVWTSNADQLQVGGQQFAKLHPLVFEDMVNNSVFIRRLFMGHEPKPCGIYTMPHFIIAACLDSAATSVHENFFLSLMKFGLWLITDGLRIIALTIYNSVLGCMGSIYHLLSLSIGYAQSTGSELDNSCCKCSVNLCLDVVTAVQLDPKFTYHISNQIACPDDNGMTISYSAMKVNSTNLVLVKIHGNCSKQDNYSTGNQSFLPCAQCSCTMSCTDSVHRDAVNPDLCSRHRQSINQTCHENAIERKYACSDIPN